MGTRYGGLYKARYVEPYLDPTLTDLPGLEPGVSPCVEIRRPRSDGYMEVRVPPDDCHDQRIFLGEQMALLARFADWRQGAPRSRSLSRRREHRAGFVSGIEA